MLRDLTFCDEKFSFRLERLSMLFSLTTGAKILQTKSGGQGWVANPVLTLHGLVLLGQEGADRNRKRFRVADPFRIPVALVKNNELLALRLSTDHDEFTGKLLKSGLANFLGLLPYTGGEGHGGFDLTLLPHNPLEVHPRGFVRELKLDGHGKKSSITRIGSVSFVGVSFSGLAKETHIGSTAEGVVGGADGLGHGGDDLLLRAPFFLRNGDGFRLYR